MTAATTTDPCRRPLRPHEEPHLQRLGILIATTRRAAGLSSTQLAIEAEISRSFLYRLEHGRRRTTRSTLTRLAEAITAHTNHLDSASLLTDMIQLAGPALAEESAYAERKTRRRAARTQRHHQAQARAQAAAAERWFWQQRIRQRARYQHDLNRQTQINRQLQRAGRAPQPLPQPADYGLPTEPSHTAHIPYHNSSSSRPRQ